MTLSAEKCCRRRSIEPRNSDVRAIAMPIDQHYRSRQEVVHPLTHHQDASSTSTVPLQIEGSMLRLDPFLHLPDGLQVTPLRVQAPWGATCRASSATLPTSQHPATPAAAAPAPPLRRSRERRPRALPQQAETMPALAPVVGCAAMLPACNRQQPGDMCHMWLVGCRLRSSNISCSLC